VVMLHRNTRAERGARVPRPSGAILAAAVTCACGCSLIVDKNANQCSTDSDCAKYAGTICVDRACVVPSTGLPPQCSVHQDCVDLDGPGYFCRPSDRQCIALLSPECTTLHGDYTNPGAIFIGSLLPTTGPNRSFGKPAENSIGLALDDFTNSANGLPPVPGSSQRRPLVLVGCDDSTDPIAAAKHLTADLEVPAIIGAAFSGVTIKVATEVTIPAGTLLISPSATSVALTSLQDNGLVWRTSPSDTLQADALSLVVPTVEANVRSELGLGPGTTIKVAIAHKGDAYGKGLTDTLEQKLTFNGKPALQNAGSYMRRDYGDPDAGTARYETVIADILAFKPHILLLFGTNESVSDMFGPIEARWTGEGPAVSYQPRYLFSDGGLLQELSDLVGTNNDLRLRVRGTVPGTGNSLYNAFLGWYQGAVTDGTSPDAFGTAGAYDATYLIAYSIVSLGGQPLTGSSIAAGFGKLVPPGSPVSVGSTNINDAFAKLSAGENIDFNGASGPLDFDLSTGEAPSDIQVWCLPRMPDGKAGPGTNSGQFYNAATGQLQGEPGAVCN